MDEQQHDLLREDLAAYALGAIDPMAASRVERHLAGCAACRALATEYAAVADLIPFGLAVTPSSPDGRERLLAAARGGGQGRRRVAALTARLAFWWGRPAGRALVGLAAVLVLALGLAAAWGLPAAGPEGDGPAAILAELRGRPDVRILALAGSPAAPEGAAELLLPEADVAAGLAVEGLPPLPPGRSYQFWFVRPDQSRVSGGVFDVDDRGRGLALVTVPPDLAGFGGVGVTEEPAGGSPAPTGTNVLGGVL